MTNASTLGTMSPQLLKVVERAQQEPEGRFHSLAHLIDVSALERAYRRSRKDAAVGVDGVTKGEYGQDLKRNLRDLHERMKAKRYRHQPIRRPSSGQQSGKGPATFDFLGYTFYWTRNRKGRWGMLCKTRSASLRRFIGSVYDWCRRHRHASVKEQHTALKRRIQGHFNYFGVSGNFRSLLRVIDQVKRIWYKWLCRRSQRKRLTWERFEDLLRDFPLPRPRIAIRIWGP